MVNGISGYNYQQYQNTLNLLRMSGLRQSSMLSPVNPVKPVTKNPSDSYKELQTFLKDYQGALTSLETAASRLTVGSTKNVFNDYEAAVTDSSVAEIIPARTQRGGIDIDLEVHTLAQAQKNASAFHYANETVGEGASMEFEVIGADGNKVSVAVAGANENGTSKSYNQMYQEAAQVINSQSSLGVKASVMNEEGKVSLVFTAKNEGEAGGFTVTGNTGAAAGIENAAMAAQNAVYSVTQDGRTRTFESVSNRISLDNGRIDVQLKGSGTAKVYTGVDEDKIVSAVKDLVDSYNSAEALLKNNAGRGTGAASHLASFGRGMADVRTLNSVGISYNKDGKLEVDEGKLKKALEDDYEGTKSIIGGQFGIAEKAAGRAEAALSDSVQRIAGNSIQETFSTQNQNFNSLGFQQFSNFARSGPYNIGNYYTVGLLMNTLA